MGLYLDVKSFNVLLYENGARHITGELESEMIVSVVFVSNNI